LGGFICWFVRYNDWLPGDGNDEVIGIPEFNVFKVCKEEVFIVDIAEDWIKLLICDEESGWWSKYSFLFWILLNNAFCFAFEKTFGIDIGVVGFEFVTVPLGVFILSNVGKGDFVLADRLVGLKGFKDGLANELSKNDVVGTADADVVTALFKFEKVFKLLIS